MYKFKKEQEKGITLIALIITIIVLIILAELTIGALMGDNGIIIRTTNAREKNKIGQEKEYINLAWNSAKSEKIVNSDPSTVKDTELSTELKKYDKNTTVVAKEESNDLIITYEETKRQYTISQNGKIKSILDLDTNIRTDLETGEEAVYEPHTITYNANGGEGTVESQTGRPDDKIILRENGFTRSGYSFVGWDTDEDGTGTRYSAGTEMQINNNMILYAQWSKDTVTISFNNNDGTGTMESIEIEPNEETALPTNTFTKEGYVFGNWNTESNGSGDSYADNGNITLSSDVILYAQWLKEHTIEYNANNGTGIMENQKVVDGNSVEVANNQFTRDGYRFVNWNTNANGTGTSYNANDSISPGDDIILYAQWEKTTITISFDANNGTGTMEDVQAEIGKVCSLPSNAFTRRKYNFIGWSTNSAAVEPEYTDTVTAEANDMTLYAVWEACRCVLCLDAGEEVIYTDGEGNQIPCIVLYDSLNSNFSTYGVQIIAKDIVGNVSLGNGDTEHYDGYLLTVYKGSGVDEFNTAKDSYNNAIDILNNAAMNYLNTDLAADARCVGSVPNNKSYRTQTYKYVDWIWFMNYVDQFEDGDSNLNTDYGTIQTRLGITAASTPYWFASRRVVSSGSAAVDFCIEYTNGTYESGTYNKDRNYSVLCTIGKNYTASSNHTKGLRPVFKLYDTTKFVYGANHEKILVKE